MSKRIMMLLAAMLLALPLGANVAMAGPGGNSNDVSGDTGEACPPNSPQGEGEDPSCGNEDHGNSGDNGGEGQPCPPQSPNAGAIPPNCGQGADADADADGADADADADGADADADADGADADADADGADADADADGADADADADGADADADADGADADADADAGALNLCTAPAGDPGLPLTEDTLGQTLYDGGLNVSPLFEDPEANGPLSGAVYDGGADTPLEPITDEVGCAVDLLIDESVGGDL